MNSKKWIFFIFICLLQLLAPAKIIMDWNDINTSGVSYMMEAQLEFSKSRDAIRVNVLQNKIVYDKSNYKNKYANKIYLVLGHDDNGYLKIKEIVSEQPTGKNYLQARFWWMGEGKIIFNIFANEYKLPAGNKEGIFNIMVDNKNKVVAHLKIKKGVADIEKIKINGSDIEDFIR